MSDRSPGEGVEGKTVLQVHDSNRDCRKCCCLGTHDSRWKVRRCSNEVSRMQIWVTDTFDQIMLGCAVQCHAKMWWPAPCRALLCYIMLCCAVLHHAMHCHAMLRHAVPCHGMLCRAVTCLMCCTLLYHQSNVPGRGSRSASSAAMSSSLLLFSPSPSDPAPTSTVAALPT